MYDPLEFKHNVSRSLQRELVKKPLFPDYNDPFQILRETTPQYRIDQIRTELRIADSLPVLPRVMNYRAR